VEEQAPVATNAPVELPRGRFPGKLDDKGRLKLPAAFHQFFNGLPEKKLFLTSIDRRIAQLYPIAEWRKNERLLDEYYENPEAAENIAFNANDLGADVEMDGQGRITVHTDLRRALGMEGTDLHLIAYKGHVDIFTDARYEEKRGRTPEQTSADVAVLRKAGLR